MLRRLRHDQDGATLAYVALMLTALLGVVGLSFDLGRHYILSTELQKAADAAAVAGAYQLDPDGSPTDTQNRVTQAVQGSPIARNRHKLGAMAGIVSMQAPVLLRSIPADDATPIGGGNVGPPYNYVQVTTQAVVSNNIFARVVGQPASITIQREAVARKGRAICQVTPLAVCNPAEATNGPGAAFDPADYYGHQILVRQIQGNGAAWTPGNFGFLDVPGYGNGAGGLANALGRTGSSTCFNTTVETEPGQTNGARNALNTRFDMYENPFFKNAKSDPNFAPAQNVIKGFDTSAGNFCNSPSPAGAGSPLMVKLPRDTDLSSSNRFGNGQWMCASYWQAVHPGVSAPSGCGASPGTPTSAITRFEVYRYEIDNGLIPPGVSSGAPASRRERGTPMCATTSPAGPVGGDLSTDRRVVTMAVLNCLEHNIHGSTVVAPEAFLNGFITEPVLQAPSNPDSGDMVLEIVGSSIQGNGGLAAVRSRDWVEVVR